MQRRLMRGRCRAFTVIEVVVVLICLVVAVVVVLPMLARPTGGARILKDGTQIREIHQAMIVWSRENNGMFPRPGLIDRLPVERDGALVEIPDVGDEDIALNTTAHIYSAMIMQNWFGPQICVGPTEPSGNVVVDDDYDYTLYSAAEDVYWDAGFKADLAGESNTSYAHMVLFGERLENEWRETFNTKYAAFGNRGPVGGVVDGESVTYEIHGGREQWMGNVCFNDNHVAVMTEFTEPGIMCTVVGADGARTDLLDNFFTMETGAAGSDMILSFTKSMSEDGPELQHD